MISGKLSNIAAWLIALLSVFNWSCYHHPETMFRSLPSSGTHIAFTNQPDQQNPLSILSYIYYYNGAGVAVGDINGDGLPDLYFAANSAGHNKLYLNKGNFVFEDITDKAGVAGTSDWCTGVTMADVNGDGLLDIYVCAVANMHNLHGHNELFINNGNGTFTESAAAYGLDFSGFSTQAVFFDFDHDGDLDCFILNQSEHPNQNITDTSARHKLDKNAGGRLLRNDLNTPSRRFTDISQQAGIYQSSLCYGLGITVADFNNDGWDDIYIGNDFHENDYYYINNHDGTFGESGADHFRHYSRFSMGNDAADFDNDGQLDLVTTDMLPPDEKTLKTYGNGEHLDIYTQKIIKNGYQHQVSRNCLQRNNGDGVSFSDVALLSGVSATDWSWSPLFADFDNDGNKDLFISTGIPKRPVDLDFIMYFSNLSRQPFSGSRDDMVRQALDKMPDGASHPYLFRGSGGLGFADSSDSWGTGSMKGYYNGAAYADLDNDGNLDLVINCLNAPAVILQNRAPHKNALTITLRGSGANTSGIGAKVYVYSGGHMQFQELMLTRGFMSSSEPRLHFGLDSAQQADSVLVVWPGGSYQLLTRVAAGRPLTVREGDGSAGYEREHFFGHAAPLLTEITATSGLSWKHRENEFLDFNSQYLIPHMESTRGPKLAVGDVNGDGLDDFYACGGSGQPGVLMLQTRGGGFVSADTAVFAADRMSEGVDAVFFDANGDGHLDLYVVSGGNELQDGDPRLADHLYLGDGRGGFRPAPAGSLPVMLANKSCVAVADVNGDGHADLFVGGLADARKFGYAQPSYLLLGDGRGHFSRAPESVIALQGTGMVTAAGFADLNGDGRPDLVVAGEWMGVKVYLNQGTRFEAGEIPGSTGLWQSLLLTDVNGDGKVDILAGNWGHNSKLWSGKSGPLKLYVKDFDNNGSVEQVMTYRQGGTDYTCLGKHQLELELPILKKMHLTYSEVAGEPVDFMFGDLFRDYRELQAAVLGSSCFTGDGQGHFTRTDLPDWLQLAPLMNFIPFPPAGKQAFITGGNFFGVLPFEGRYDAMVPTIFSFDSLKAGMDRLSTLPTVGGEIRDFKWIRRPSGKSALLIALNNQPLMLWEPVRP